VSIILEERPRYSIIIVNFNGGEFLINCLDSVFRHTSNFELILADNNSTDESALQATCRFAQVTLLKNERNMGFARANNAAIRKSQGDWIVLLNPDTIVTANWLDALVECGASWDIGLVGPKLVRSDRRTIDSAGLMFDPKTGLSYDRGSGEVDRGQFDTVKSVPCCTFACVAIRREVIENIGLLDQEMNLYFEDVDYCIRARMAGWSVMYCPKSVVFHVRGGVTPKSSTRPQKWSVAYRLRIMLKCYENRNVIKFGGLRILHDFVSAMAGLKNNDLEYFLGYMRSPIWNLLNLPLVERKQVQHTRNGSDKILFQLIGG
jgi:GT2 family glycosyltransferase